MKRNGGILSIRYRGGINCFFVFLLLTFPVLIFAQEKCPMFYEPKDSCFCRIYSTCDELSVMAPDKIIESVRAPLDSILRNLRIHLLEHDLKDSVGYGRLIMQMTVDKEGVLRCGIVLMGREDAIAQKVYDLLRQEKYTPAMYGGKPAVYFFYFMLKKE